MGPPPVAWGGKIPSALIARRSRREWGMSINALAWLVSWLVVTLASLPIRCSISALVSVWRLRRAIRSNLSVVPLGCRSCRQGRCTHATPVNSDQRPHSKLLRRDYLTHIKAASLRSRWDISAVSELTRWSGIPVSLLSLRATFDRVVSFGGDSGARPSGHKHQSHGQFQFCFPPARS